MKCAWDSSRGIGNRVSEAAGSRGGEGRRRLTHVLRDAGYRGIKRIIKPNQANKPTNTRTSFLQWNAREEKQEKKT